MKNNGRWVIVSKDGYWSNDIGWVYTVDDATFFSDQNVRLPIGRTVRWTRLKENMKIFDYSKLLDREVKL